MPEIEVPENPPAPPEERDRTPVRFTSPAYKQSVVDSKVIPFQSILSHVAGSSLIVDYYSQVIGENEEVSPFQPGQQAVYQQYWCVHELELKLPNPWVSVYANDTSIPSVTGSATIYPIGLKPNFGDAFIADIGDGRAGQFTVTSAVPLAIMSQTGYTITFELARLATPDIVALLTQRTVRNGYFMRDYLRYGQNPIVGSEHLAAIDKTEEYIDDLTAWYRSHFLSNQYSTYLIPGQMRPAYDPFLTRFLVDVLGMDDSVIGKMRLLDTSSLAQFNAGSVWDAILQVDPAKLYGAFTQAGLLPINAFNGDAYQYTLRYSGISYIISPTVQAKSVDSDYGMYDRSFPTQQIQSLNDGQLDLSAITFLTALGEFTYPDQEPLPNDFVFIADEVPHIYPIAGSTGYVFSAAFYAGTVEQMSKLEVMVYQFINYQQVNPPALFAFCDVAKGWGRLEQYYYIPVLLAMLLSFMQVNPG